MPSLDSYVGSKINRLSVLEVLQAISNRQRRFLCLCECGKTLVVNASHVTSGHTKSCGCLAVDNRLKHGACRTPVYWVWRNMVTRCTNKTHKQYKDYGGRGITVCDEWLDVEKFLEWARDKWSAGMQIDRIDNESGYSPSNCRFTTSEININNRRPNTNSITKISGVSMRKGKFQARIYSSRLPNKRSRSLGVYNTIGEALDARNKFILENGLPHKVQELSDER